MKVKYDFSDPIERMKNEHKEPFKKLPKANGDGWVLVTMDGYGRIPEERAVVKAADWNTFAKWFDKYSALPMKSGYGCAEVLYDPDDCGDDSMPAREFSEYVSVKALDKAGKKLFADEFGEGFKGCRLDSYMWDVYFRLRKEMDTKTDKWFRKNCSYIEGNSALAEFDHCKAGQLLDEIRSACQLLQSSFISRKALSETEMNRTGVIARCAERLGSMIRTEIEKEG